MVQALIDAAQQDPALKSLIYEIAFLQFLGGIVWAIALYAIVRLAVTHAATNVLLAAGLVRERSTLAPVHEAETQSREEEAARRVAVVEAQARGEEVAFFDQE